MRALFLSSAVLLVPCLALAGPQCILPSAAADAAPEATSRPVVGSSSALSPSSGSTGEPGASPVRPPVARTSATALDHVVAAGAQLAEAGTSHGLRTVVARSDGQFVRMYVAPDGQALVTGLMAELSATELFAMAPGQVTELGRLHGLRGLFVRNGGQFQVFYAVPGGERVIPGAMFDAQGKNLTRDQIAAIPGAIPTVVIGDLAAQPGQAGAASARVPAGSLLDAVESTTHGTVGSQSAPRLWVFVDPLCAWSVRAVEQLRPLVAAGRVQLAVVPVSVLDHENQGRSTVAAKAMLSLPPDAMVAGWGGNKLNGPVDPAAGALLDGNMAAANAIGLRGTPTFVWRKADGTEGRADGAPNDLGALVASIGK